MEDKKVKLGTGVVDNLKEEANREMINAGKLFIGELAKYLKTKIKNIDWDKAFTKKEEAEMLDIWSMQLSKEGLIPKGYEGLQNNLLVDNLHQDGYLSGLYIGYLIAMMSLVDNEADDELIVEVRNEMRKYLYGHHYNDKSQFQEKFQNDKYRKIDELK